MDKNKHSRSVIPPAPFYKLCDRERSGSLAGVFLQLGLHAGVRGVGQGRTGGASTGVAGPQQWGRQSSQHHRQEGNILAGWGATHSLKFTSCTWWAATGRYFMIFHYIDKINVHPLLLYYHTSKIILNWCKLSLSNNPKLKDFTSDESCWVP